MIIKAGNLFARVGGARGTEHNEAFMEGKSFRCERIVSFAHATPAEWYDQTEDEWVVLLAGSAGLLIEGERDVRILRPGDWIQLPAHLRHRVEWTDETQATVWLALHYQARE